MSVSGVASTPHIAAMMKTTESKEGPSRDHDGDSDDVKASNVAPSVPPGIGQSIDVSA